MAEESEHLDDARGAPRSTRACGRHDFVGDEEEGKGARPCPRADLARASSGNALGASAGRRPDRHRRRV